MYNIFCQGKDKFDFCNYPENSKVFDDTNKMIISKTKDEARGFLFVDFVGLKSKLYLYTKEGDTGDKKKKEKL